MIVYIIRGSPAALPLLTYIVVFGPEQLLKQLHNAHILSRFYIGFFVRGGGIIVCGNVLKLGGLGAWSPRKILKFTTSETAAGGF